MGYSFELKLHFYRFPFKLNIKIKWLGYIFGKIGETNTRMFRNTEREFKNCQNSVYVSSGVENTFVRI